MKNSTRPPTQTEDATLLREALAAAWFPMAWVVAMWIGFGLQTFLLYHAERWGVLPRSLAGLWGVITMPFIHGSLTHLVSNTVPMLLLGWMLFFFYRNVALPIFLLVYVLSGLSLWLFAWGDSSEVWHIGSSGVAYSLMGVLLGIAIFKRDRRAMAVAFIAFVLYSGMLEGIVPNRVGVSWQSHLLGLLVGFCAAYYYRNDITDDPLAFPKRAQTDDDTHTHNQHQYLSPHTFALYHHPELRTLLHEPSHVSGEASPTLSHPVFTPATMNALLEAFTYPIGATGNVFFWNKAPRHVVRVNYCDYAALANPPQPLEYHTPEAAAEIIALLTNHDTTPSQYLPIPRLTIETRLKLIDGFITALPSLLAHLEPSEYYRRRLTLNRERIREATRQFGRVAFSSGLHWGIDLDTLTNDIPELVRTANNDSTITDNHTETLREMWQRYYRAETRKVIVGWLLEAKLYDV